LTKISCVTTLPNQRVGRHMLHRENEFEQALVDHDLELLGSQLRRSAVERSVWNSEGKVLASTSLFRMTSTQSQLGSLTSSLSDVQDSSITSSAAAEFSKKHRDYSLSANVEIRFSTLSGTEASERLVGGYQFIYNANTEHVGSVLDNKIYGFGGNDEIYALDTFVTVPGAGTGPMIAASYIEGGTGNDTIYGSSLSDTLFGGEGNDVIRAAHIGNDNSFGYSDVMSGGAGDDTLLGSLAGNDTLGGDGGNDLIFGGSGNNVIFGGNYISAGFGNDTISSTGSLSSDNPNDLYNLPGVDGGAGDDLINLFGTHLGNVVFEGGLGNDTITLNNGTFFGFNLKGGAGSDTLVFSATFDSVLIGSFNAQLAGFETLVFGASSQRSLTASGTSVNWDFSGVAASIANSGVATTIQLTSGADTYIGSSLSEYVGGGAGDDLLNGGSGNDTLAGLAGNDTLIGGDGADVLVGSDGSGDTVSYLNSGVGLKISLTAASNNTGEASGDTFNGIENVIGSNHMDEISGDAANNLIIGALGNDSLFGGAGDDTLNGGGGADLLDGGDAVDVVSYAGALSGVVAFLAGSNLNTGDAQGDAYVGIENLIGSDFADFLGGTTSNNLLQGGDGNDALYGADGNDTLGGGFGTDILDGQDGFDFASYASATSGLTLFMGGGTFNSGEANGDTHTSIEGLIGSNFSDIIGGDAGINELRGLGGNDFIYGRAGIDTLLGGDGNDVLSGGLDGDRLDGEAGIDVAFYRDATTGITASLLTGGGTGEASGDTYLNIENIWGSDFDDVLTGDNLAGQVYGFAGNDNLSGLGGDDFFYGGVGSDTITGGAGIDSSFFLSWNDKLNQFGTPEPYEGGDVFTDFASGIDRIILSRFWFGFGNIGGPAAALTETHANFVTNGTVATSRPSLIWNQSNRTLSFDADGNGATQAVLLGTLQSGATLTLGDIWTA
jgi:Ca2+-binding RTX toxin-like protein